MIVLDSAAIASKASARALGAGPRQAGPDADTLVTLHPGDVACAGRGTRFVTLLGSCVSILLSDPARTIGAMCHFVTVSPAQTHAGKPAQTTQSAEALAAMFTSLRMRGIDPLRCEAWVIGGGNMFPGLVAGQDHIGASNSAWAVRELERLRIPIVASHVGGNMYRKVLWTIGAWAPAVIATGV